MSMAAILRATLHTLRSSVPGLRPSNSQVTYNGQPPPSAASPLFLSIYPSGWRPGPSQDIHEAIEDEYAITLAINMRTSVIPRDRWGEEAYLQQSRSIEQAARELRFAMYDKRYDLLTLANQYAGISVGNPQIIEPLMFDNAPLAPEPMPAEWFHAEPEGDVPEMPDLRHRDPHGLRKLHRITAGAADALEHHGLLLEMVYTGGRRIAPIDRTEFRITVSFLVTTDTSPEIKGTYNGQPDSIVALVNNQSFVPDYANGFWSIPAGSVTLPIGVYDVLTRATYRGGDVSVTNPTTDEVTILDPDTVWAWTDGSQHIWSDSSQARWT